MAFLMANTFGQPVQILDLKLHNRLRKWLDNASKTNIDHGGILLGGIRLARKAYGVFLLGQVVLRTFVLGAQGLLVSVQFALTGVCRIFFLGGPSYTK